MAPRALDPRTRLSVGAAALGDTRWRELLERYHALVRREVARFRGGEVDTAGDGLFATFDGPALRRLRRPPAEGRSR
jgi:class 3 adenylate cyclase